MSDLVALMAELYPRRENAEIALDDVGLRHTDIDLTGAAITFWGSILREAQKHDKLDAIVLRAVRDYQERTGDLTAALNNYRNPTINNGSRPISVSQPRLKDHILLRLGLKAPPPELDDLKAYLRALSSRLRHEIGVKTYLPLDARFLSQNPLLEELNPDPFVSPIHQIILHITGRVPGGDSSTAQIAAVSRKSRVVKNVLKLLEQSKDPLILLGEPGSGKTMTLQEATLHLAEREARRVFPLVPLYVRLGEFHVEGRVKPEHVWEYVKKSVSESESLSRYFDKLYYGGRLIILFDGMDEMSRDHYNDHTEALSRFAGEGWAKTLFSCRITDFSPKFLHQRLVLLPFNQDQVAEYLKKYIQQGFPITIDSYPWKLKSLAKHIVEGDLPIEANNPFVLWLLSLYIQREHKWPQSRVELLEYFNEQNYQRKREEYIHQSQTEGFDVDIAFPVKEVMFTHWGQLAYSITERNLGPAMPVALLEDKFTQDELSELLWVGKRCGVLTESRERHEHLVRFEHHRFQEYFTARHIHQAAPPIDWLTKLDAPRWQETMLNLILLGEEHEIVDIFASAIAEQTETCRLGVEEIEASNKRLEEEAKQRREQDQSAATIMPTPRPIVLPDEEETSLADRVELCSRILRQIGSGAQSVRERLEAPFRDAVDLLATHGTPITQVKMLRACQNVPDIGLIDALRKPLNSPINWVRNQALILIASSQSSARVIGSDLPTEIGYDLATGLVPMRLSAYWTAITKSGKKSYWWSWLIGSLFYVMQVLLLLVVAGLIYYGAWSLRDFRLELGQLQWPSLWPTQALYFRSEEWAVDFSRFWPQTQPSQVEKAPVSTFDLRPLGWSVLGEPIFVLLFVALLLSLTIISLRKAPSHLWIFVLGAAVGYICLLPAVITILNGHSEGLWGVVFFVFTFILPMIVFGLMGLIALLIHMSFLLAYLALSVRSRQPGHSVRTFISSAWHACAFDIALQSLGIGLGLVAFAVISTWAIGWGVGYLVLPVLQMINDFSHLPFHPIINITLIFSAGLLLAIVTGRLVIRMESVLKFLVESGGLLLFVFLFLAFFNWLINLPFVQWLASLPLFVLIQLAAILIVGGIVFVLLKQLWSSLVLPNLQVFNFRKRQPGTVKPEKWREQMKKADPDSQYALLSRTDYQSLGLTPFEYLQELKALQGKITRDPAASEYWRIRHEIEEALRQERRG